MQACLKDKLEELYGKFGSTIVKEIPRTHLMTFQEFNVNSNKNKPPCIKEMFGKCLFQISGLSEEKCFSILNKYSTPSLLFKAYADCSSENERAKLLSNLKYGKQNRFVIT